MLLDVVSDSKLAKCGPVCWQSASFTQTHKTSKRESIYQIVGNFRFKFGEMKVDAHSLLKFI